MSKSLFHLAIQVGNLEQARDFYHHKLGFAIGRQASNWIDFNCFGHQLVTHLNPNLEVTHHHNQVDGESVPVPHFGIILTMDDWQNFADKLKQEIDHFLIPPTIRFAGQAGEQATLFFLDPFGNALEFKGFKDVDGQLFAT